jgi:hypothetical protein
MYRRDLYTQTNFYKESGRYQMFASGNLGKGDLNVYRMFVETALAQVRKRGFVAQLAPEGLYKGANAAAIRAHLFQHFRLRLLVGCVNLRGVWFPSVHPQFEFCLYAAEQGSETKNFSAAFRVASVERLVDARNGRVLDIPVSLIREFSPDALAIMEFAAQSEIDVCRKMYSRYPHFGDKVGGMPNRVYMREVDMGSDLFTDKVDGLPVFEGRMVDLYDYRAKGYSSGRGRAAEWIDLPFGDPAKAIVPQWRIPPKQLPEDRIDRISRYRIGFCDVVNPATEKCLVSALIPPHVVCGRSVLTIVFDDGDIGDMLLWIAVANSLVMDFVVRKKVRLHMTYTVVDSLPFPRDRRNTPASMEIISRAFALAAVGREMSELPKIVGIPEGITPVDNPDERARLFAEIEVLVAREVFGLTRDELRYVLDPDNLLGQGSGIETFRVLRDREKRQLGEYRTQRLVQEAWDRFARDGTFGQQAVRMN